MTNIKSISHAFGMSTDDFAKLIGYTRQGLYAMRKETLNKNRLSAAIQMLSIKSAEITEAEISEAKKREEIRKDAIKAFEDEALGGAE